MSFTVAVVLFSTFDALVVAALAAVCRIPFRLDREAPRGARAGRVEVRTPELVAA